MTFESIKLSLPEPLQLQLSLQPEHDQPTDQNDKGSFVIFEDLKEPLEDSDDNMLLPFFLLFQQDLKLSDLSFEFEDLPVPFEAEFFAVEESEGSHGIPEGVLVVLHRLVGFHPKQQGLHLHCPTQLVPPQLVQDL